MVADSFALEGKATQGYFTVESDYEGTAPSKAFMENPIKNDAGFQNVKFVSTVTWEITTTQKKATVEDALERAVDDHGTYRGGKLTRVNVT